MKMNQQTELLKKAGATIRSLEDANDCIAQLIAEVERLSRKTGTGTTPYAWRNPANGCTISDDKKQNLLSIGNGYPNFSKPLYLKQE